MGDLNRFFLISTELLLDWTGFRVSRSSEVDLVYVFRLPATFEAGGSTIELQLWVEMSKLSNERPVSNVSTSATFKADGTTSLWCASSSAYMLFVSKLCSQDGLYSVWIPQCQERSSN